MEFTFRARLALTLMLALLLTPICWSVGRTSGDTCFLLASGGMEHDYADEARETPDGGCIVVGGTYSFGDEHADILLLKYDAAGSLEWARTAAYGITYEYSIRVAVTTDHGYLVAGQVWDPPKAYEVLLLKYDSDGNLLWSTMAGGSETETVASVMEASNGDYVVAGQTLSFGVAISAYLMRFDSDGSLLRFSWAEGPLDDLVYGMCQTSDGGYIVAGQSTSYSCDGDAMLVKFTAQGDPLWFRTYGGPDSDIARAVVETADGGLLVTGETLSFGEGLSDVLLFKTDSAGAQEWARSVGGTNDDSCYSIALTTDGGYMASGRSDSYALADDDVLMLKFDPANTLQWSRAIGGYTHDSAGSGQQTADGGYLLSGRTRSVGPIDGSVLLVRTDPLGLIAGCPEVQAITPVENAIELTEQVYYPTPNTDTVTVSYPYITTTSPTLTNWEACRAQTVGAELECSPLTGTLPFSEQFRITMTNQYSEQSRRIAGRIRVDLANGSVIPNWKQGWTNIDPDGTHLTIFSQTLPSLSALVGVNEFTLVAVDVTPSPYNQPPYPMSGDTATDSCRVTGSAP